MLAAGARAEQIPEDEQVRRCIDVLVGVVAGAVATGREWLESGSSGLADEEDS
jgi:hypothetical protein